MSGEERRAIMRVTMAFAWPLAIFGKTGSRIACAAWAFFAVLRERFRHLAAISHRAMSDRTGEICCGRG
jgi:hypothetical protein